MRSWLGSQPGKDENVHLASGADWTIIPKVPCDLGTMCSSIERNQYSVILVAEGAGGALAVAQEIKARVGMEPRVSILGHLQRGGVPTPADRVLAKRLGVAAVDFLVTAAANTWGLYAARCRR